MPQPPLPSSTGLQKLRALGTQTIDCAQNFSAPGSPYGQKERTSLPVPLGQATSLLGLSSVTVHTQNRGFGSPSGTCASTSSSQMPLELPTWQSVFCWHGTRICTGR